jgi:putative ABC transport system substrate-binding protein
VIGFVHARSREDTEHLVSAFHRGLAQSGYTEGQDISIEYRWASGQYDQLPQLVAELVRRPVTLLVAGADPAALAAKTATSTIPIVFSIGGDPVKEGLVASFSRPGGNATGISILSPALEAKRLGLMHELVPRVATVGALVNPNFPPAEGQQKDLQEAARSIGLEMRILRTGTDAEIDAAFETVTQERVGALMVTADPFFDTRRDKLVALAARHAVPTSYHFREYAAAGGLMSYGIDLPEVYRQMGGYVARILKGAKPADLPVELPTKFEFVINLKTAKALGLDVPLQFQQLADDVIE